MHALHAENALTAQWLGHGPRLHCATCLADGQASPPYLTLQMLVVRVRTFQLRPHDLKHDVYWPHWPTAQSSGQNCWLHARASARYGHA